MRPAGWQIVVVVLVVAFPAYPQSHVSILCNFIRSSSMSTTAPLEPNLQIQIAGHKVSGVSSASSPGARRIMLLQDTSGSMRGNLKDVAWTAVEDFARNVDLGDRLALVDFNDHAYIDVDFRDPQSFSQDLADRGLKKKLLPKGPTAVFDAVWASETHLAKDPHPGDSIVIISDSSDNASHYGESAVEDKMTSSPVRVYLLWLGNASAHNQQSLKFVNAVIETGGAVFETDKNKIGEEVQTLRTLIEKPNLVQFDVDPPIAKREEVTTSLDSQSSMAGLRAICPHYLNPQ